MRKYPQTKKLVFLTWMRDPGVWITCVQFFSAGLYIFFFRPAVGETITWIEIIFSSDLDFNEGCKILSGQSSGSYFKKGFEDFLLADLS